MQSEAFLKTCDILYKNISDLNKGSLNACVATTKYLAKSIGKSERQTYRYLKYLQEDGKIDIDTSILKKDRFSGKRYRLRKINLSKKYTQQVEAKAKELEVLMVEDNESNTTRLKESKRVWEEAEREEFKDSFKNRSEDWAAKQIGKMHDGTFKLKGSNNMERLADLSIINYRKIAETMAVIEDAPRYVTERLKSLAAITTKENGQYFITIMLGGQIPYKVSFFDYVIFDSESAEFKEFLELYKGK